MQDEEETEMDGIFAFLAPDIAAELIAQWEQEGKPEIASIDIDRATDSETGEEMIYVGVTYLYEEEDEGVTVEKHTPLPIKNWYEDAVERLQNGEM